MGEGERETCDKLTRKGLIDECKHLIKKRKADKALGSKWMSEPV